MIITSNIKIYFLKNSRPPILKTAHVNVAAEVTFKVRTIVAAKANKRKLLSVASWSMNTRKHGEYF